MQDRSLRGALFDGVQRLNSYGLPFHPNQIALKNDFEMSSGYSGPIALPSTSIKPQRTDNGYDFLRISNPEIETPDAALEDLWECTKKHYGLTAVTGLVVAGSIPVDKMKLGYWVSRGASSHTNLVSHLGLKFFPLAKLPPKSSAAKLAKATFGTIRIFGIVGRALPFACARFSCF